MRNTTDESVPDAQTHVRQPLEVQLLPLLHGVEVVSDGRGLGLGDGPGVDHVPLVALLGVEGQPKADEGARRLTSNSSTITNRLREIRATPQTNELILINLPSPLQTHKFIS